MPEGYFGQPSLVLFFLVATWTVTGDPLQAQNNVTRFGWMCPTLAFLVAAGTTMEAHHGQNNTGCLFWVNVCHFCLFCGHIWTIMVAYGVPKPATDALFEQLSPLLLFLVAAWTIMETCQLTKTSPDASFGQPSPI